MREPTGLTDPRETFPEMGENQYAMHEPPSRMELLADLLKETHRIEKHADWLERSNANQHDRIIDLERQKADLTARVVSAERTLVACERQDNALPAAVYLETLDEGYIATLRSDNEEASSF